jgi:cysteine-rich repeat protein
LFPSRNVISESDDAQENKNMRRIFTSLFFLLAGMVCIVSGYPAEAALGTCGNDVVEKFEQCDDGNLSNVDGCSSLCQKEGEEFQVMVYTSGDPPPTPALEELPLLTKITRDGITWTFAAPVRVRRFVNGDYSVVGGCTIVDIQPLSTAVNGRHGSM